MSKLSIFILGIMLLAFAADAKYVAPDGVESRSDKISSYQMKGLDEDKDGKLTEEEYKERFNKLTREDRRNQYKAQKEGTYKSPEDQFKAMDINEDGKVTEEEMSKFISKMREEGNYFY